MEDTLKHTKNTESKGCCIYKEATMFFYLYKFFSRCFFSDKKENNLKFSRK